MKFTLSWLKEHLDTNATLAEVRDALTMLGLEVEGITNAAETLKGFVVGYVVEAVQHPNADRLRVCKVDTGSGVVQVVCGAPNARTGPDLAEMLRATGPDAVFDIVVPAARLDVATTAARRATACSAPRASCSWATTIAASSTCRPRPRPALRPPKRSTSTIR